MADSPSRSSAHPDTTPLTGETRTHLSVLIKIALALLLVWLVGVLGPFNIGTGMHVLLLVGLMLLLLGVLKARDAAMGNGPDSRLAKK